jgi:HNH endonuclease
MQAKNTTLTPEEKRAKRNAWHRTPEAQAKRRARNGTPEAVARRKAYNKQWHEANREAQAALSKQWVTENKERVAAAAKRRREAKKKPIPAKNASGQTRSERRAATLKKWRTDNRGKVRASKLAWETANPEKAKAAHSARNKKYIANLSEEMRDRRRANSKKWGDANPEKRAHIHSKGHVKRKAKLKDAGSFTLNEWKRLIEETGHKCVCCGMPEAEAIFRFPRRGEPLRGQLTRDHIVPLCDNGTNTISNIQPTCLPCNMRKHRKHINYLQDDAQLKPKSRRAACGGSI